MIVYMADTALLHTKEDWERCAQRVDATRLLKARQCRHAEDKKRSLLAGCLIQTAVRERLYGESGGQREVPPLSLEYACGENGKPYLKDYPEIFFNLSHSGTRVVCAVSDEEVGVDIQRYAGEKREVADRFFSAEDRKLMEEGVCRGISYEEMFYRIWTVKEAYMKRKGQGMRLGMDRIPLTFTHSQEKSGVFRGRVGEEAFGADETQDRAFFAGRTWQGPCLSGEAQDDVRFAGRIRAESYALAVCSGRKTDDINLKQVLV